jgi:hypothetical protein
MLSDQIDQAERRRVLLNDAKVREQQQTGTYLSHTHSDLGGRYAIVSPQIVVGAEPHINYPACSPALAVQLPPEPPLGFDNPALEPASLASPAQAPGPTSDDPSPLGRGVGPSFFSQTSDPAGSSIANPPGRSFPNVAGSLPLRRRKL